MENQVILKNSDHCQFCDHLKFDFKNGTFCALTNKRPEFQNTCIKIDLNETYKEKIKEINTQHQFVLDSKSEKIQSIIFYGVISIAICFLSYSFTLYLWNVGYVSTVTVTSFFVALVPLGKAISIFNHYRTSLKIAKKKKAIIDSVTELYGYSYDISIERFVDSLGNIEYTTELDVKEA